MTWAAITDDEVRMLCPLPDSDWTGGTLAYTAEQMRAYALQERAAERERCARLIEPKNEPSDWTEYAHACADLARKIRSRA